MSSIKGFSENFKLDSPAAEPEIRCKYCKLPLKHILFVALMQDFGARAYPSAIWCSDSPNNKHDFSKEVSK